MEPATFVVTALAGAVLKEVATDSYKAVKAKLVEVFGLGKAVEAVEEDPGDEDARAFLAAKVAKSGALDDAEVVQAVDAIAAALEKLPAGTGLGASMTVENIKAERVEFLRNTVHAGGALTARDIEGGEVRFEGNVVGDDR